MNAEVCRRRIRSGGDLCASGFHKLIAKISRPLIRKQKVVHRLVWCFERQPDCPALRDLVQSELRQSQVQRFGAVAFFRGRFDCDCELADQHLQQHVAGFQFQRAAVGFERQFQLAAIVGDGRPPQSCDLQLSPRVSLVPERILARISSRVRDKTSPTWPLSRLDRVFPRELKNKCAVIHHLHLRSACFSSRKENLYLTYPAG